MAKRDTLEAAYDEIVTIVERLAELVHDSAILLVDKNGQFVTSIGEVDALSACTGRIWQELLGHSSLEETVRYSHLSPYMKRDTVALLDEADEGFRHGTRAARPDRAR